MNRYASAVALSLGLVLSFLSACQPAAPDTNREATTTANANMAKEPVVDRAAIETEVLRLEREWYDASKNHNVDTVKRIVADDVVMTYPDGTTGTKADEVKAVETGAITFEAWELIETKLNVLDNDAAVLTGRSLLKNAKYKGPDGKAFDVSGQYRFTDVFARRNGNWQVVASQAMKIENPPVPSPSPSPKASPAGVPSPPAPKASPSAATKTTP